MNIKTLYRRFRAWQLNPFSYQNHSQHVERCANCGTEFQSNYCPVCGQKSGVGPVGWKTVRQGLMVIWGMDSRSLGFTIIQLLLRPGYLISDYISGKRQASFPPVKMLLIVAIVFMIAATLKTSTPAEYEEIHSSLDLYFKWTDNNPGWSMMAISCLFLLPTWLLYRFSPKHRKHTLPEGFFIQVFMGTLLSLIGATTVVADNMLILAILLPFYYLVTYRQLFGYGWWGTFWRLCICFVVASGTVLNLSELCDYLLHFETEPIKTILYANGTILFIVLIGVFFEYRKKNRKSIGFE